MKKITGNKAGILLTGSLYNGGYEQEKINKGTAEGHNGRIRLTITERTKASDIQEGDIRKRGAQR